MDKATAAKKRNGSMFVRGLCGCGQEPTHKVVWVKDENTEYPKCDKCLKKVDRRKTVKVEKI